MSLQEIRDIIESVAPLERQEEWDNSGLQIGSSNTDIRRVLLSVDVTEAVVQEAQDKQCQLILSHHPLLFRPLRSLTEQTAEARCAMMAIRSGIAIYSSHTAMDNYLHGVSGKMAQQLGITDYRILVPQSGQTIYGLGVIGNLPRPIPFDQLLLLVKQAFGADALRYVPPFANHAAAPHRTVQTIALCGGAGSEFQDEAMRQGAEVYISADFKYHSLQAAAGRIAIIDMDHWVSEHFTRNLFAELLSDKVETIISTADRSPIQYI